jgi:hypothetical protein
MYTIDHELNLLASSLQRGNRDLLACVPPPTMGLESVKTLELVHTQPHMYVVLHRTTQNQHHNPSATEAHPYTNIQENYHPKTFILSYRTILRHGNWFILLRLLGALREPNQTVPQPFCHVALSLAWFNL